jgi:hypothetical protein
MRTAAVLVMLITTVAVGCGREDGGGDVAVTAGSTTAGTTTPVTTPRPAPTIAVPSTEAPTALFPECITTYGVALPLTTDFAVDWTAFCAGMDQLYAEWTDMSQQARNESCELTGAVVIAQFLMIYGGVRDERLGYMEGWWNECGPQDTPEQSQLIIDQLVSKP